MKLYVRIILVLLLFRSDVPLYKKVDYDAIIDFGDEEVDIFNNSNNNNNNKHVQENFTADWYFWFSLDIRL